MAHPPWGGIPTASEEHTGTTLLHPRTAEPTPARAEGTVPSAAAQIPTESSAGRFPRGRGSWKPGEGGKESWILRPCPVSTVSSHLPPYPPQPIPTPGPLPSLVSFGVGCRPAAAPLLGCCPGTRGPRWSWHCLTGCSDPTPSNATPSGYAESPAASCPGGRSYRKGQVSPRAPASPPG